MHTHHDEAGLLVRCYHESKALLLSWQFWVGITCSFPLEHVLWEKVWPFYLISQWIGL